MPILVECCVCGNDLKVPPSKFERNDRFFCKGCWDSSLYNPSKLPNNKAKINANRVKRLVEVYCPQCGKKFKQFISDKLRERRFCSVECYRLWAEKEIFPKWHRKTLTKVHCLYCGKVVEVPRSIAKTKKFCSMKCRNYWDSEHPNYLLLHLPKPNQVERKLAHLLQRYFPNEWEYTGDGKVVLHGLIPDFTNKNGRKAVIELFGDYWHTKRIRSWKDTELGKIMAYKALGFECLVIWEKELKDEERVVSKISNFF